MNNVIPLKKPKVSNVYTKCRLRLLKMVVYGIDGLILRLVNMWNGEGGRRLSDAKESSMLLL